MNERDLLQDGTVGSQIWRLLDSMRLGMLTYDECLSELTRTLTQHGYIATR